MLIAVHVVAALVLLVLASDGFTNAVEWVGALYGLTRSAVGAVVAAIGSSLPETVVAIIALLVLRDPASQAVGIGAVVGAPFMLATAVFGLVGLIAIVRRRSRGERLQTPLPTTMFGLGLFALTFAVVIAASFAPTSSVRIVASIAVLAAYAAYIWYHVRRGGGQSDDKPARLRFAPRSSRPMAPIVFAQLLVSVAVTVGAARWFIGSVTAAADALQLSPLLVSLVLSPIATELPEMMNVALWMRRGADELALGNVIGAMMFQTSIASTVAMLASPWRLDRDAYAAAVATFVAVGLVIGFSLIRRRPSTFALMLCGALYVAYLAYVIFV